MEGKQRYSGSKGLITALLWLVCTFSLSAQAKDSTEVLNYDIHYKYGLVFMKGGSAQISTSTTAYRQQPALKSSLSFKTSSFFDKMHKMRDTLTTYVNANDYAFLYHRRGANNNDIVYADEILLHKQSTAFTEMNLKQVKNGELRTDTVLSVTNLGYDLIGTLIYVRNLDFSKMTIGQTTRLTAFSGRKAINLIITYRGQSIVERSDNLKYKTLQVSVDIADDAFADSKSAIEVWLSDDANHLPVKMKAKLKIGAAEANLSSYKGLKYPFSAEIKRK
jgi:hypothetical protein